MKVLRLGQLPEGVTDGGSEYEILDCGTDGDAISCAAVRARNCPIDDGAEVALVFGDTIEPGAPVTGLGCVARAGLPVVVVGRMPEAMPADLVTAVVDDQADWVDALTATAHGRSERDTALASAVCASTVDRFGLPLGSVVASVDHDGSRLRVMVDARPAIDEAVVARVATRVHAAVIAGRTHIPGADVVIRRS